MRSLLAVLTLSCVALAQTTPAHRSIRKPGVKTATAHRTEPKMIDASQTFPAEPGLYAAFNTTEGRVVCILYEKESPITVKNFVALARGTKESTNPKTGARVKKPFYNGVTFHRVIPGFMIQGGDPTGTGSGSGGVETIPDEFDPTLKFDQKGRLAMANTGRPHTGSTQFFITDGLPEYLNGKHTIFGQVVEGQDIVTKIAAVPQGAGNKPETPVVIKTLIIHRVGPAPATAPKPAVRKRSAAAAKKS